MADLWIPRIYNLTQYNNPIRKQTRFLSIAYMFLPLLTFFFSQLNQLRIILNNCKQKRMLGVTDQQFSGHWIQQLITPSTLGFPHKCIYGFLLYCEKVWSCLRWGGKKYTVPRYSDRMMSSTLPKHPSTEKNKMK